MQRSRTPRRRLSVESLEERSNPTNGVPWLDPLSLTLSFVPDGTDISGTPSNLHSLLGETPPDVWKREILRAYQTWALQANINIGLVGDGGQPLGTAGAPQKDPRFGDIRVGARRLSTTLTDSVAGTSGFEHAGGTWSGDLVLNDVFAFGVGDSAAHDLFSVAIHEAGNSLGLRDKPYDSPDKSAVMWPKYQPRTGLGGADVTAIQGLYGPRVADAYEGPLGNETRATAHDLTANGNRTAITGDVTTLGDVDVYQFTTPEADAASGLRVQLQAAGVSLFTGRLTVYDAAGVEVGTAVTIDPLANDIFVDVPDYQADATYSVRVEGAGTDVFSAGAYNLRLAYSHEYGTSAIRSTTPYVNYEGWWGNWESGQAQPLHPISAGHLSTFAVGGLLTSPDDADWFQTTPAASASGTLTVSVWAWEGSPLLPAVSVYTAGGVAVPAEVVANDNGTFTVQAEDQPAGQTYFIRVAAADPSGPRATGVYVMGANLGTHPPTFYDSLTSATLTAAEPVVYSTMTVDEARLTQFSLSAAAAAGTEAAVRMSVFDAAGDQVFTVVTRVGEPIATGAVWLPMGTYTVVLNAATRSGAALPSLTVLAGKRERSSPIDPYLEDVGDGSTGVPPPPPNGSVRTSPPTPTPPPGPIDPISDPYMWF